MILGNQVEWALHCMMILGSLPEGKTLSAKALAEFHDVPRDYLAKCLQSLSQAGLVTTTPGKYGGYSLSTSPDKISFLDIIEAVEGKTKTFKCNEIRRNNPCLAKSDRKFSHLCDIASVMFEADEAWRKTLREKKLSAITSNISGGVTKETMKSFTQWIEKN